MKYPDSDQYLAEPKLEMFYNQASKLSTIQSGGDSAKVCFQKLTAQGWADYMAAHAMWVDDCKRKKVQAHTAAVAKRAWAKVKEVPVLDLPLVTAGVRKTADPYVSIKIVPKTKTEPIVSKKEGKVELRSARKELIERKQKAKAQKLDYAGRRLADNVLEDHRARTQASKLNAWKPVARAEVSAAKLAAQRAKVLGGPRSDHVADVVPADDGWKVVTRKKGDKMVQVSCISQNIDGKEITTHRSFVDPSVAAKAQPLVSSVRKPTASGSGH